MKIFYLFFHGVLLPIVASFHIRLHKHRIDRALPKMRKAARMVVEDAESFDLIVLGAGPVGVGAALAAAESGRSVCLVDAPEYSGALMDGDGMDLSLGGPTGLFSKALRDTSKRISVSTLRGMGISENSIWSEVCLVCQQLARINALDRSRTLQSVGVTRFTGFARFLPFDVESGTDVAGGRETNLEVVSADGEPAPIRAKNVLVATGSSAFRPKSIPFDEMRVLDSDSVNGLKFLPRSIAITGSGIIAIEYAKIFQRLGADVTLLIRDRVPKNALQKIGLDTDVAATLVSDLVRSGIRIERGVQAVNFEVPGSPTSKVGAGSKEVVRLDESFISNRQPIRITLEPAVQKGKKFGAEKRKVQEKVVSVDAYLAAVGRTPNTEGLGLGTIGVDCDEFGGVIVDSNQETSVPGIYGAGDVVGRPFLASTGVAQGAKAVKHMFSDDEEKRNMVDKSFDLAKDPFAFPVGVWTSPESAYYGLTIKQAQDRGYDGAEGLALYRECLRGCVFSPDGLLKLVFDKTTGVILGVHIVGDDACELIHYGMELVRGGRTMTDVTGNMYSAVTFHELYQIAARAGLDPQAARQRRREAGASWASLSKARRSAPPTSS